MNRPRARLGRGLESLIPVAPEGPGGSDGVPQYVPIDQVRPSPEQQRKHFAADQLRELADSIRQHGVLQPLLVRRLPDGFELIAGERRWRAARQAGLQKVPAIVRGEVDAHDSLLLGLIENLQREDLDPIEEAQGIRRLIESFGLTHEDAAARLGKHRVAVSQALRLLNGCPALLSATSSGALSAGHARALVGLPSHKDQEYGLKVVLARRLSVRQTEKWVQDYKPQARKARPARAQQGTDPALAELQERLHEGFGDAATISGSADRGRLTISFASREELDRLLTLLLR
jgi:ParB family transcriptional regulator, chromosome partitioning protein